MKKPGSPRIDNNRSYQRRRQHIFHSKTEFARKKPVISKNWDDEQIKYSVCSAKIADWRKRGSSRISFIMPEATKGGQQIFHLKTEFARQKKLGLANLGLYKIKDHCFIGKKNWEWQKSGSPRTSATKVGQDIFHLKKSICSSKNLDQQKRG